MHGRKKHQNIKRLYFSLDASTNLLRASVAQEISSFITKRDLGLPLRSRWPLCSSKCITKRTLSINYRRFGTTYRSHLQGWINPNS